MVVIESDRPRLRRGKSVEPLPDDDVPGYSKPGAQPALTAAKVTQPVDTALQLIPAISDAAGPAPRSYAYEWLQGEESQRHDEMMALAKTELRAYLKAEAKEEITPPATGTHSTRRKAAMKAAEPIFENVQLRADRRLDQQPAGARVKRAGTHAAGHTDRDRRWPAIFDCAGGAS